MKPRIPAGEGLLIPGSGATGRPARPVAPGALLIFRMMFLVVLI